MVAVIVGALVAQGNNKTGTATAKRPGHGDQGGKAGLTTTTTRAPPPPAVKVRLLAWRLPVAVSRAVVLAGPGANLIVAGGLTRSGASGNGAFLLSTRSGVVQLVADLPVAVHDASGAILAGRDVIFGGDGTAATAMVQAFAAPAGAPVTAASVRTATATAALPQPRTGSGAVTVGTTSYVVGGSDGTAADRDVLATTDGKTFLAVAALAVPVEYPAVAAVGGYIFVFGGATVGGHPAVGAPGGAVETGATAQAGAAVDDIQRIDRRTGRATIVGHLPAALQGASAATLDGNIYLAGGRTASSVQGTIWAFEPASATVVVAGHLRLPVSNSGLAVIGSTAWLVGGQSGGRPVASVQTFGPVAAGTAPTGTGLARLGRARPSRAQPGGPSTTSGAKSTPSAGATT